MVYLPDKASRTVCKGSASVFRLCLRPIQRSLPRPVRAADGRPLFAAPDRARRAYGSAASALNTLKAIDTVDMPVPEYTVDGAGFPAVSASDAPILRNIILSVSVIGAADSSAFLLGHRPRLYDLRSELLPQASGLCSFLMPLYSLHDFCFSASAVSGGLYGSPKSFPMFHKVIDKARKKQLFPRGLYSPPPGKPPEKFL